MAEVININENVRNILIKHSHKDNLEESLNEILRNEIQRKIKKHMLMIKHFERKYDMDFEDFEEKRVTKEMPYEIEKDYFEWDMAITLIEDLEEELAQLESWNMFSSTDEIARRIRDLSDNYQWLISYRVEQKSVSILKAKIIFNEEMFIQIYINTRKPKISYNLKRHSGQARIS